MVVIKGDKWRWVEDKPHVGIDAIELVPPTEEERRALIPGDKVLIEAEVINYQYSGEYQLLKSVGPMDTREAVAITERKKPELTSDVAEGISLLLLGYSIKELHDVISFARERGWKK